MRDVMVTNPRSSPPADRLAVVDALVVGAVDSNRPAVQRAAVERFDGAGSALFALEGNEPEARARSRPSRWTVQLRPASPTIQSLGNRGTDRHHRILLDRSGHHIPQRPRSTRLRIQRNECTSHLFFAISVSRRHAYNALCRSALLNRGESGVRYSWTPPN